jgi:tetratricopeptide (TPR) repeat protein
MQTENTRPPDAGARLARTEAYLAADPGNPGLLARAIDHSLEAGDVARAERHAQAALALYPDDAFLRYRQAHVLCAQQQWDAAAAVYGALLAGRADVNLAHSLAWCLFRVGRHQAALDTLAPYRGQPDLPAATVTLLVRALHHAGAAGEAVELVEQNRERLAGETAFLAAASLACLDEGKLEQAAALSEAALEREPRAPEALVVRATLLLANGDGARASAQFSEVLAAAPEEGRAWSGLGIASLLGRDLDAAAVQLEQAVKYLPSHVGSMLALGWCKIFSDDLGAAEAAFRQACARDRNFAESHGGLAVVAALRGDRSAAEAGIQRALRLDRASLSARYAQMVLQGQTADPARFRALAFALLGTRTTATGESLAEHVKRHVDNN